MEENFCISALYNQLFDDVKCGGLADKAEFIEITYDLLLNEELRALKNIQHHHNTNRLMHSMHVAYYCFYSCKKRELDYISATRGALLHDFFRLDLSGIPRRMRRLCGFYHPRLAMNTAAKTFNLNDIEKNCILRHMFPLTIVPAKYKEAWFVIFWDKVWGTKEYFSRKPILEPLMNFAS